jgi:glycosyltransferase involved in cell wall biosynthesis
MKVHVVANVRLPSERANALQTVKMCDAFARCGADVCLVRPWRFQSPAMRRVRDWRAYYGVRGDFTTRRLPTIDLQMPLERFVPARVASMLFQIENCTFTSSAWCWSFMSDADVIYTREPWVAGFLPRPNRRKLFLEVHQVPAKGRGIFARSLRRADGVVTISRGLAEDVEAFGVPRERLLVAPDGVDVEAFANPAADVIPPALPAGEVAIGYTGQLLKWKGVHVLAEASKRLPGNATVYFLGGTREQVAAFEAFCRERSLGRVKVLGFAEPRVIPGWLSRFDVVVLPNSARERISAKHTSPLKLFEYMASGKPIVASDLPSIREVLADGVNAALVTPDDAQALADGIRRVLGDRALAAKISAQARTDAGRCSWTGRAEAILEFVGRV